MSRNFGRSPWAALAAIWRAAVAWQRRAREELRDDDWDAPDDDPLTFVVLAFRNGARASIPLSDNEDYLAAFLVPGTGIMELGRTRDPWELERLMGGKKEGAMNNDEIAEVAVELARQDTRIADLETALADAEQRAADAERLADELEVELAWCKKKLELARLAHKLATDRADKEQVFAEAVETRAEAAEAALAECNEEVFLPRMPLRSVACTLRIDSGKAAAQEPSALRAVAEAGYKARAHFDGMPGWIWPTDAAWRVMMDDLWDALAAARGGGEGGVDDDV